MKNTFKKASVFLIMTLLSMPLMAGDDKHDKWIDVLSMDWGRAQVGASTRLDNGNYKTDTGQYLIVRGGKVTAKGPNYRLFKPDGAPVRASRKSGNESPKRVQAEKETQAAIFVKIDDIKGESSDSDNKKSPSRVRATPQKGIEPDEIDAKTNVRRIDKASPNLRQANAGGRKLSVEQMMPKLRPRGGRLVATDAGGNTSSANKVAAPKPPSRYEIADCGTPSSPMICCNYGEGDTGSTCNMFKLLCTNAGGTAQGDGTDATCSDWP
ncbi:MAG: hypothetical protein GWP02_01200 [Desulfobulbaceae bacterium]|nr:hypothetical protein [Desulfobulbaceae bacterium]